MKQILYKAITKFGINTVQKLFPEQFASMPLRPTDRYVEYNFVCRFLPPPPATILDVGCSGSYFPLILSGLGYKVTGTDVRQYPMLADNFNFLLGDIKDIKGHWDFVTCVSTLEHIGIGGRYGVKEDLSADKKAVDNIMTLTDNALFTIPFGKHKLIRPDTRIYDKKDIHNLFGEYRVLMEFWTDHGNWKNGVPIEKEVGGDNYDLCCLYVCNHRVL